MSDKNYLTVSFSQHETIRAALTDAIKYRLALDSTRGSVECHECKAKLTTSAILNRHWCSLECMHSSHVKSAEYRALLDQLND